MTVIRPVSRDNLWLCPYCHDAAIGSDETIVDQGQAIATEVGLTRLDSLGELTPDCDLTGDGEEVSDRPCACCGTGAPAPRTRPMRRFLIRGTPREVLASE